MRSLWHFRLSCYFLYSLYFHINACPTRRQNVCTYIFASILNICTYFHFRLSDFRQYFLKQGTRRIFPSGVHRAVCNQICPMSGSEALKCHFYLYMSFYHCSHIACNSGRIYPSIIRIFPKIFSRSIYFYIFSPFSNQKWQKDQEIFKFLMVLQAFVLTPIILQVECTHL